VQSSGASAWLLAPAGSHPAWLDEEGSVHSLETGKVLEENRVLSPYSSAITTIMIDSSGSMWVGTPGNGVIRYSNAEGHANLQRYTRSDGLSSDFIRSLFEDEEHNIWERPCMFPFLRFARIRIIGYLAMAANLRDRGNRGRSRIPNEHRRENPHPVRR
jgi:hypothetical protein